jgi:hypothetical protein
MGTKLHTQHVSINDQRRENKKVSDVKRNGSPKQAIRQVYNSYYKDQVRALYNAVFRTH